MRISGLIAEQETGHISNLQQQKKVCLINYDDLFVHQSTGRIPNSNANTKQRRYVASY